MYKAFKTSRLQIMAFKALYSFGAISCFSTSTNLAWQFASSHLLPVQSFSCAALLIPALKHFWWNVRFWCIAPWILYGKELKKPLIPKGHFLVSIIMHFHELLRSCVRWFKFGIFKETLHSNVQHFLFFFNRGEHFDPWVLFMLNFMEWMKNSSVSALNLHTLF